MAVVHLGFRKQPNGNNQNWNVVAKSLTRIHQSPLNIIHFSFLYFFDQSVADDTGKMGEIEINNVGGFHRAHTHNKWKSSSITER
jgi:hypothetical protein